MQKSFTSKEIKILDIYTKGYASKRRVSLLQLVASIPSLSVEELSEHAQLGYQTTSVHLQKLTNAGLITKKYKGLSVVHACTKRGVLVLKHLSALLKN